jgi:hypothetical protein
MFVEQYSFVHLNKNSILKLMWYSLRFRLVDWGILLTKNEKKIASLRNKYKGKRCFIIGNGPSLNTLDLSKLKNEFTFGVNAIYLNYENMGFYPNFYVIEDYLVAEDRAEEINSYNKSDLKFFGTYLDYVLKKDSKSIHLNVQMKYTEPFSPFFSTNCVRKLGVGGSVTFLCLQLAYYMGFETVYMIGFDHNYHIPKEAKLDETTVILSESDDINHFSKSYFGKGYRWHDPKVDRMAMGFLEAKNKFEKDGRKIINATNGGKLEVFPRVTYNKIFQQ